MTQLATDEDDDDSVKGVLYMLFDATSKKLKVTSKDLEQLLNCLCELEKDKLSSLESANIPINLQSFFLVSSTELIIEHHRETFNVDPNEVWPHESGPACSLTRLLLDFISKSPENLLDRSCIVLRSLLCLTRLPECVLSESLSSIDSNAAQIGEWKHLYVENKTSKHLNLFRQYKESSLAAELWSELSYYSMNPTGSELTIEQAPRRVPVTELYSNVLASTCVQAFWQSDGGHLILNRLRGLRSIFIGDDPTTVRNTLETGELLSQLFLMALQRDSQAYSHHHHEQQGQLVWGSSSFPLNLKSPMFPASYSLINDWVCAIRDLFQNGVMWTFSALCRPQHEPDDDDHILLVISGLVNSLISLRQYMATLSCGDDIPVTMRGNVLAQIISADLHLISFVDSLIDSDTGYLAAEEDASNSDVALSDNLKRINCISRLIQLVLATFDPQDSRTYRFLHNFAKSSLNMVSMSSSLDGDDDDGDGDSVEQASDNVFSSSLSEHITTISSRPFQSQLLRIAVAVTNSLIQLSDRIIGRKTQERINVNSSEQQHQQVSGTPLGPLLPHVLGCLNNALLLRLHSTPRPLTRSNEQASIGVSPEADTSTYDDAVGHTLAKLVDLLDRLAEIKEVKLPVYWDRVNAQMSRVIYFLASGDSPPGQIVRYALDELGYKFALPDHAGPQIRWPLWPGSRLFALLACHIINEARLLENVNVPEGAVKLFWSGFLDTISQSLPNVGDDSKSRTDLVDISPNLLQFACFLTGKVSGLTAKKQLLQQLTTCLCTVASRCRICWEDPDIADNVYRLSLRLIIILRYVLHYFYVPSTHLLEQLKPSILLNRNTVGNGTVWRCSALAQTVSRLQPCFRPRLPQPDASIFYDILLPVTEYERTTTEVAVAVLSQHIPSADGLATLSLVSQGDYNEKLLAVLDIFSFYFSMGSGNRPVAATSDQPEVNKSMSADQQLVAQCRQLSLSYYGIWLSQRICEVLPPSIDFFLKLKDLLSLLSSSTGCDAGLSQFFGSPSRLIYLTVLLDRLKGPNKSTGTLISQKLPTLSLRYATLYKAVQCEKQLGFEIYRSFLPHKVSADTITDAENVVPTDMVDLSSADGIQKVLTSFRPPLISAAVLLQVVTFQLTDAELLLKQSRQTASDLNCGNLAYWIGLLRFLSDLATTLSTLDPSEDTSATYWPKSAIDAKSFGAVKVQPSIEPTPLESANEHPEALSASIATVAASSELDSPPLTNQQVSNVYGNLLHTGRKLLLMCLKMLSAAVNLIRDELRLPFIEDLDSNMNNPQCSPLTYLSLISPERLVNENAVPSADDAGGMPQIDRRRLAVFINAAMAIHRDPLSMLAELMVTPGDSTATPSSMSRLPSNALFGHILGQFRSALTHLESSTTTHGTTSESDENLLDPSVLAKRLRLIQLCQLSHQLASVIVQLVKLFSVDWNDAATPQVINEDEALDEYQWCLSTTIRLFFDPVCHVMGINLLQIPADKSTSVAQYLLTIISRSTLSEIQSKPCRSNPGRLMRHVENWILRMLVRFLLWYAKQDSEDLDPSIHSVCREAFGYLEVATGSVRVAKASIMSEESSVSLQLPLLSLFSVAELRSRMDITDSTTATFPSHTYQFGILRLLCIMLMRALNAAPKYRSVYCKLAQHALDKTIFSPDSSQNAKGSLLHYWLTTMIPIVETEDRHYWDNVAGSPWLTDLLTASTLLTETEAVSDEPRTVPIFSTERLRSLDTEEAVLCAAVAHWYRENGDLQRIAYSPESIGCWLHFRDRYRFATYFERLTRLLASDWNEFGEIMKTLCARILSIAINVWRDPVLHVMENVSVDCPRTDFQFFGGFSSLIELPLFVSSLHCLSMGCPTGAGHVQLLELFFQWSVSMTENVNRMRRNGRDNDNSGSDLSYSSKLRRHNELSCLLHTLRGIYAYVSLLTCVLNPTYTRRKVKRSNTDTELLDSDCPSPKEHSEIVFADNDDNYPTVSLPSVTVRADHFQNILLAHPSGWAAPLCETTERSLSQADRTEMGSAMIRYNRILSSLLISSGGDGAIPFNRYNLWCLPKRKTRQSGYRRALSDQSAAIAGTKDRKSKSHSMVTVGSTQSNQLDEYTSADGSMDDDDDDDGTMCVTRVHQTWGLSDRFLDLPGPCLNDWVCSFTASQKVYIQQHWYHCLTCNLTDSEGCCSVCAQVCHAGHDLCYAKQSTFFCDCAANDSADRHCHSMTYRIQTRNPYTVCGRGTTTDWISRMVTSEQLSVYAPWLADGYPDDSHSAPFLGMSPFAGDTEDDILGQNSDRSDINDADTTRPTEQRLNQVSRPTKSRLPVKHTSSSSLQLRTSEPSTGVILGTSSERSNESRTGKSSLVIRAPSVDRPTPSSSKGQPFDSISPCNPKRTGHDGHPCVDIGSGVSLRRAGAIRQRAHPSSVGVVQSARTSLGRPKDRTNRLGLRKREHMQLAESSSAHTQSLTRSVITRHRFADCTTQREARRRDLVHFLHHVNRGDLPYAFKRRNNRKQSYKADSNKHALDSLLSVMPDELSVVMHIRKQFAVGEKQFDPEKQQETDYRSKLLLLLSTSPLLPQAAQLLIGPEHSAVADGSKPPPGLIDQLLANPESSCASSQQQSQRYLALTHLLTDQRERKPLLHICSDITLPVPHITNTNRDIWYYLLQSGCSLLYKLQSTKVASLLPVVSNQFDPSDAVNKTVHDRSDVAVTSADVDPARVIPQSDTSVDQCRPGSPCPGVEHPLFSTLLDLLSRGETNVVNSSNSGADGVARTFSMIDLLLSGGQQALTTVASSSKSGGATPPVISSSSKVCVLRIPVPSKRKFAHFLIVNGANGRRSSMLSTAAQSGPAATGSGVRPPLASVYKIDGLLKYVANCQDTSYLETIKLRAVTALLQSRQGRRKLANPSVCQSTTNKRVSSVPDLGESEAVTLSDTCLQKHLSVSMMDLPYVCTIAASFNSPPAVNPIAPGVFAFCMNAQCIVLGLSSAGFVCGRITLNPHLSDPRAEQLIKPIWLPDSLNLLAILTTRSIQIFDLYRCPERPKYHFKPVDGSFTDATFIRIRSLLSSNNNNECSAPDLCENTTPLEWGIHLVAMAKMGCILHQELGPDCFGTNSPFILAEWLDWDVDSLTSGLPNGASNFINPIHRNPTTGVLGGGGVSIYYMSSLSLLLHAYQSGHSVASAICQPSLSNSESGSSNRIRISHSFLLAVGATNKNGKPAAMHSQPAVSDLYSASSLNPNTLVSDLLFAAHSSLASTTPSTPTPWTGTGVDTSGQFDATISSQPPPIGPIMRWSEVLLKGHCGLISAVGAKPSTGNSSPVQPNHQPVLLAIEPNRVWIQPICTTGANNVTSSQTASQIKLSATDPPNSSNHSNAGAAAVAASSSSSGGGGGTPSNNSSAASVVDAISLHWEGRSYVGTGGSDARTMTFLLTADDRLLIYATRPKSYMSTAFTDSNSPPSPGHFWWQPYLNQPEPTDSFDSILLETRRAVYQQRAGLLSPLGIELSMEAGGLWDSVSDNAKVACNEPPTLTDSIQPSPPDFTRRRTALAMKRRLLRSEDVGPLPVDFFEYFEPTNEVDFGGFDLLQLYNHDQLRTRLTTSGCPVTGTGSSVYAQLPVREHSHSTGAGKLSSVAYALEIYNRKPLDNFIVGIRISLPASTGELSTQLPSFFKIFDRVIPVNCNSIKSTDQTIDIPLYYSEILLSVELLVLFVGASVNADRLTTIDGISVYVGRRSEIERIMSRDRHHRPADKIADHTKPFVSVANRSSESALVRHLDRLFATGFVTCLSTTCQFSLTPDHTDVYIRPAPLPPPPSVLPLYLTTDPRSSTFLVDLIGLRRFKFDALSLIAAISDLICSVLHTGFNIRSSSDIKHLMQSLTSIAGQDFHILLAKSSSLLNYLLMFASEMNDTTSNSSTDLSILPLSLARSLYSLTLVSLAIGEVPGVLGPRALELALDNTLSGMVDAAVGQLIRVLRDHSSALTTAVSFNNSLLLYRTVNRLTSALFKFVQTDRLRLCSLLVDRCQHLTELFTDSLNILEGNSVFISNSTKPSKLFDPMCTEERQGLCTDSTSCTNQLFQARRIIISLIRGLFAVILSTEFDDDCKHDVSKGATISPSDAESQAGELIMQMLVHPNLTISCAARDGLSQLILGARPKMRINWCTVEQHSPQSPSGHDVYQKRIQSQSSIKLDETIAMSHTMAANATTVPTSEDDGMKVSRDAATDHHHHQMGTADRVAPYLVRRRRPRQGELDDLGSIDDELFFHPRTRRSGITNGSSFMVNWLTDFQLDDDSSQQLQQQQLLASVDNNVRFPQQQQQIQSVERMVRAMRWNRLMMSRMGTSDPNNDDTSILDIQSQLLHQLLVNEEAEERNCQEEQDLDVRNNALAEDDECGSVSESQEGDADNDEDDFDEDKSDGEDDDDDDGADEEEGGVEEDDNFKESHRISENSDDPPEDAKTNGSGEDNHESDTNPEAMGSNSSLDGELELMLAQLVAELGQLGGESSSSDLYLPFTLAEILRNAIPATDSMIRTTRSERIRWLRDRVSLSDGSSAAAEARQAVDEAISGSLHRDNSCDNGQINSILAEAIIENWDSSGTEPQQQQEQPPSEDRQVTTSSPHVAPAIDNEPSIQLLDMENRPEMDMALHALLENADDDALLNYALQLSLRDQGGPEAGIALDVASTDHDQGQPETSSSDAVQAPGSSNVNASLPSEEPDVIHHISALGSTVDLTCQANVLKSGPLDDTSEAPIPPLLAPIATEELFDLLETKASLATAKETKEKIKPDSDEVVQKQEPVEEQNSSVESDLESMFAESNILSPIESCDSVGDSLLNTDESSSSSGNGHTGMDSRFRRPLSFSRKDAQNELNIKFCLRLCQYFTHCWPRIVSKMWSSVTTTDNATSSYSVQTLVPALQLVITLVRTLHANAVYLNHRTNTATCTSIIKYTVGSEPERTDCKAERDRQQLHTIRRNLKALIEVLVSSLTQDYIRPAVAVASDHDDVGVTTSGSNDQHALQRVFGQGSVTSFQLEVQILVLNTLSELFAHIPQPTRGLHPHALSLLQLCQSSSDSSSLPVNSTASSVHSSLGVVADKSMNFCLCLLEWVYDQLSKRGGAIASTIEPTIEKTNQSDKVNSFDLPDPALDAVTSPNVTGLLQASLFSGINVAGLLCPSGANRLTSWSPLLDSQYHLENLSSPLDQLGWLSLQASLRLPRLLLQLSSIDCFVPRGTNKPIKQTIIPDSMQSRWHTVLYNLDDLFSNRETYLGVPLGHERDQRHNNDVSNSDILPVGGGLPRSRLVPRRLDRFHPQSRQLFTYVERQIRSLLIGIVGPKHFRHLWDIHRFAHLIQDIYHWCVDVGGLSLSCASSLPQASGASTELAKSVASRTVVDSAHFITAAADRLTNGDSFEPFRRQLRLPYIAQRDILQNVAACLRVALNRTQYWQRFLIKCPDKLIFLAHASLVLDRTIARYMLMLIQLALVNLPAAEQSAKPVAQDEDRETAVKQSTGKPRRGSSAQALAASLAKSMSRFLSLTTLLDGTKSTAILESVEPHPTEFNPMLVQFARVFLCHSPDTTIRELAFQILLAIYRSASSANKTTFCRLLFLLWSELPTFAVHAGELVRWTVELLRNEHGFYWDGRTTLLAQIIRLMMRRLDALERHPRRQLYSTMMHYVHPRLVARATAPASKLKLSKQTTEKSTAPLITPSTRARGCGVGRSVSSIVPGRTWAAVASSKLSALLTSEKLLENQIDLTYPLPPIDCNLGFTFELEPCLLCYGKPVDDPPYLVLRWDSEPGGGASKPSIQKAIANWHGYYSQYIDCAKRTTVTVQQSQQAAACQRQVTSNATGQPASSSTTPSSSTGNAETAVRGSILMPVIIVKLDVRATSNVHVFDLDAIYFISQLTVKFNVLPKRPRYVQTLNVYTSELVDRATSSLAHEPWLWKKVATVRLTTNQTAVRLRFSKPDPYPSWIDAKDFATDARLNVSRMNSSSLASSKIVGTDTGGSAVTTSSSSSGSDHPGLPVRASRIIFEYEDFHSITGQDLKRSCPRCQGTNLQGCTCLSCHSNINECSRCRMINLGSGDVYLCANCGSARHGKIEFSAVARPCYASVVPLHDREDRDSACNRIAQLSKDLTNSAQGLLYPIQKEVSECIQELTNKDALTAMMVTRMRVDGAVPSTSDTTNKSTGTSTATKTVTQTPPNTRVPLPMSSILASSPIGGVIHPAFSRLSACANEMRAVTLDAAAIARRLWAVRQSVFEFDSTQQSRCQATENFHLINLNDTPKAEPNNELRWPNYSEIDALFAPPAGGCFSCLLAVIHHCSRTLLLLTEHYSKVYDVLTSDEDADQHWLLRSSDCNSKSAVLNAEDRKSYNNHDKKLMHEFLSALIRSDLGDCPKPMQVEMRALAVQLTRDSPTLIKHMGNVVETRLVQTALSHGSEACYFSSLVHNDIALLQQSVRTILPVRPVGPDQQRQALQQLQPHRQPMDRHSLSWEYRIRPLFRLLLRLTRPTKLTNASRTDERIFSPPSPVVQDILLPILELLRELISYSAAVTDQGLISPISLLLQSTVDPTDRSEIHTNQTAIAPGTVALETDATGESGIHQLSLIPPVISAQFDRIASLSSERIPPVDFLSWLDDRPYASFEAWQQRLIVRANSLRDTQLWRQSPLRHLSGSTGDESGVVSNNNTISNPEVDKEMPIDETSACIATVSIREPSRAVLECTKIMAVRWLDAVKELHWAKHWGVLLPPSSQRPVYSESRSATEPLNARSWLAAVLFSPSDSSCRGVTACMQLLRALTTYTARVDLISSLTNNVNDEGPRVSPVLTGVLHNRRRLVLRFLTRQCLSRLDQLANTHAAAIPPIVSTSTTPSLAMQRGPNNPGDILVHYFKKLVYEPPIIVPLRSHEQQQRGSESGQTPLVRYLLVKANFLDHLETLIERLLLQMRTLESLPTRHWDELVAANLGSTSGTGCLYGSSPGHTIALVNSLVEMLQPLNDLSKSHQYKLLHILLRASTRLRQLVLQRTDSTLRTQNVLGQMLDQLIGASESQICEFITATLDHLTEYPISDHQSAVYLLQRMCAPICPLDADQAVFDIVLEVWRGHEDYLLTRSLRESLKSDTRGLGPRIHNVIDYICTGNNLTTDMRLEIVCEGQILMPQLRLFDVYTQIWLANRNNLNEPMRLTYRIPGFESDNLPYVEHLATDRFPPEQYGHIRVLASHPNGLGDLLRRLASVYDPYLGRALIDVILHILKYCLKTTECRERLIDPELRTVPILLHILMVCFQVSRDRLKETQLELHEDITERLIRILEPVLHMADKLMASDETVKGHAAEGVHSVQLSDPEPLRRLLSCLTEQPDLPVVSAGLARVLSLLSFGNADAMEIIVQFVKTNLVRLKPAAKYSPYETALLDCCGMLVFSVPRDSRNGSLLRHQLVNETDVVNTCLRFLWDTIPASALNLTEGTELNTTDADISSFLSEPSLPHVLQMLRGCLDGSQNSDSLSEPADYERQVEITRPRIVASQLLAFLHQLESSKSSGRVGLIAEDMLTELSHVSSGSCSVSLEAQSSALDLDVDSDGNKPSIAGMICGLRKRTAERIRKHAQTVRERQLSKMHMKMDKKGQVALVETDRLAKMTDALTEEQGLTCAICREGFRNAPTESLGIYTFARGCPLDEPLVSASDAMPTSKPPTSILEGYATSSNFVTVHFTCHANSLKASSDSQWVVARRHNGGAKCNCILPILSPPPAASSSEQQSRSKSKANQPASPETVYAGHLATYMDFLQRTLNVSPGYTMALHDVKLLLVHFACNRPFNPETSGGGSRQSHLQLLPHLIQVCLHSLLMSSSVARENNELNVFLAIPESHWASPENCWTSTGPLYHTVLAMNLWTPTVWRSKRESMLRRLLYLASGRQTQQTKDGWVSLTSEARFAVYHPYLVFFGLIDGVYTHLFKNVQLTEESATDLEQSAWCSALSNYISCSDEALMQAIPNLLSHYEDFLNPIASVDEFADVVGLLGEVDITQLHELMQISS